MSNLQLANEGLTLISQNEGITTAVFTPLHHNAQRTTYVLAQRNRMK